MLEFFHDLFIQNTNGATGIVVKRHASLGLRLLIRDGICTGYILDPLKRQENKAT